MMGELSIRTTPIPGLLVLDLPLHGDNRGWFKENWQRPKMTRLGLPDFGPVQNNVSYNAQVGVTRGLHAEPWDKLVSLASGRIWGVWVDLRDGPSFGRAFTLEMGTRHAVFVPRGVANGYQSLEPDTTYSYLVNDHWTPQARASYTYLNLADETLAIDWPIPLTDAIISDADLAHPRLADVSAMPLLKTVILGANGQLGRALRAKFPDAIALGRDDLDLTDGAAVRAFPWHDVGTIVNAAAMTAVDAAEATDGRRAAWSTNVDAVAHVVDGCRSHRITLVHVSSDYVFDGIQEAHSEDDPPSPLSVYGVTKAAADAVVSTWPDHYIVRTSWVIGAGHNFVHTMRRLAAEGVHPAVVDDQYGRLTFTSTIADGISHLLTSRPEPGVYNITNDGPTMSWHDIARRVFELVGAEAASVSRQTTQEFAAGRVVARRPRHSTLTLEKIKAAGFVPPDADTLLQAHLQHC